jgi:hypothetical protein
VTVDYEEIKKWQKAMCIARRKLQTLVKSAGHAYQVIELDSDRRKRLLARYKNDTSTKEKVTPTPTRLPGQMINTGKS